MNDVENRNGDSNLIVHLSEFAGEQERLAWLDAHRYQLTVDCFEEAKAQSDALLMQQPDKSLDIAEAALQAASFSSAPLTEALARWAQGNALAYLGRYAQALDAYTQAYIVCDEHSQEQLMVARLQSNMVAMLNNLGRYQEALDMADVARRALQPWAQTRYMATLEMNVGSICRLLGHYNEALSAYERGRAIFAELENHVQVARMDINRARALVCLDRFQEAEALLQQASYVLEQADQTLPAARADLNRATLLSRQGHHRKALQSYGRARNVFNSLGIETDVAVTDMYRTYDYLALNLLPEAEELATQASAVLSAHSMPRYVALAAGNRAIATRKMGHFADALDDLHEAQQFFAGQGAQVEVALFDLERALCLREMNEPERAAQVAREARVVLGKHNLTLQAARASLILADCLLTVDQVGAAHSLYTAALAEIEEMPSLAWWAYDGLGRIAEVRGQTQQAFTHYSNAITCLEAVQDALGIDEFRAGFLDDKLLVYRRAVRLALELKRQEEAFRHIEQSKSGVWRDFVLQEAETDIDQNELRNLRSKWHWLYNRLNRPDEKEGFRGGEAGTYWADLHELEMQILQIRRDSSRHLSSSPIPSLQTVQRRIPPGTLLLDYYCTDEAVIVLIIDPETCRFERLASLSAVERLVWQWQFNVESMRELIWAGLSAQTSQLQSEAHNILGNLYHRLIAPLESFLQDCHQVWIVPHDFLWAVPFAALRGTPCGGSRTRYLSECFEIAYLPAMLIVPGVKQAKSSLFGASLVVAYSDDGLLAHTIDEGQTVSAMLGNAPLLLEADATVERVRASASHCSLLHLATHGVFRADAPLFSAVHLADGWLTAGDLETWRMPRAELVTLSACETGVNQSRGSDLLGLARGFFGAGARHLVASQWMVDDASTSTLMASFYSALHREGSVAFALQQAQVAAMKQYAHPFFWAGFKVMVGQL